MLKKTIVAAVAAAMMAGTAIAAPKAGGEMGGGMGGMGGGIGHASTAPAPSNGIGSLDRDKGVDRAMDRRSDAGNLNTNHRASPHRAAGLARADYRHDHRKATTAKSHRVASRAKTHKTAHAMKTPATKTIHRVNDTPDFRASRSREERMEQARLNWERNRKL